MDIFIYKYINIEQSATTLKLLIGNVKNIDCLIAMTPVKKWYIIGCKWS